MKKFVTFIAIIFIVNFGYTQQPTLVTDNTFNIFLSKFKDVKPPLNYKKRAGKIPLMTKEEAIKFLQKTENDLYEIEIDYNYDTDERTEYKVEKTAGCDFKYRLNDSIYILCTREHVARTDTVLVYLNSFSLNGNRMNKCVVGEKFTFENDYISFVLLDKFHIRVFYYVKDDTRKDDGYYSSVYYIDYEITGEGFFTKNHQSDKTYLKRIVTNYTYPFQSDDPMNKYDF
jgi:hypothetical protein